MLFEIKGHWEIWTAFKLISPNGKRGKGAEFGGRQFLLSGQTVRIERRQGQINFILSVLLLGGEIIEARQKR